MSSKHWKSIVAATLVAGAAGWAGAAVQVGSTFPAMAAFTPGGRVPDTKGKVVVVDFWASWCAPCKASFPALQRLQDKYRKYGVEVIAVNVDTKRDAMERFLEDHPVSFSVVRDVNRRLVELVEPQAMPTSLVIDRQGRVVAMHAGFQGEETEVALAEEIEKCLRVK